MGVPTIYEPNSTGGVCPQDVKRIRQAKEKQVQKRLQTQKQDYRVVQDPVLREHSAEGEYAAAGPPPLLPECRADEAGDAGGGCSNRQHAGATTGNQDDRALIALAKDRALAAAGIVGAPPLPCAENVATEKPRDPPNILIRGGVRAEIYR
eukprot:COSAG02_NODE_6441_length_3567_cov_2.178777_2_plen_151_part_00